MKCYHCIEYHLRSIKSAMADVFHTFQYFHTGIPCMKWRERERDTQGLNVIAIAVSSDNKNL